jgi:hypothetical protein
MRVFLSYAREDIEAAEALARVMQDNGVDVWWDRNIAGGEEFSDLIEKELARADVVVVLWSPHSVKSRWVRDEAAIGGDSGRLVPVAIEGAQPPMGFRQFHTLDLDGFRPGKPDKRTDALIRAVTRLGKSDGGTSPPSPSSSSTVRKTQGLALPGRQVLAIAVMSIVVAAAALFLWLRADRSAAPAGKLGVVLLPFDAVANDPQVKAIADQTRDFLADALTSSGMDVRLVDKVPSADNSAQFAIAGNFGRVGDKMQATVRIDDVTDGTTALSRHFEVPEAQADILSERVGAQIAGSFGWAANLIGLEQRHPSKPSVTADLLRQLDFTFDPVQGYQTALRAVRANPNSPFALIAHGFDFATVMMTIPKAQRATQLAAARQSADRALKIAPEFGDTHIIWCNLHSETFWSECERRMLEGQERDPDAPFVNAFLSALYRHLGRFDDSSDLTQLTYSRDPYTPTKIAWMLLALEHNAEVKRADELNQKGLRWWPEFAGLMERNRIGGLLERGDFDGIAKLVTDPHSGDFPPGLRQAPAIAKAIAAKSPGGIRAACSEDDWWPNQLCMVAFAQVGDLNSAFALADKLFPDRVGHSPAEAEAIWMEDNEPGPLALLSARATVAMRRDPRFLDIARRSGLLDYWRTTHLPDFCTKDHEAVCAQIRKA